MLAGEISEYNPNLKPYTAGVVSEDEGLRRAPDLAKLRRLRPAFAAVGGEIHDLCVCAGGGHGEPRPTMTCVCVCRRVARSPPATQAR